MHYIKSGDRGWELGPYLQYLRDQDKNLPPGARAFISQPWHYDIKAKQCPHDSWLERLAVLEIYSGSRKQTRQIEIVARFLGAFHDGHFELTYEAVTSYELGYRRVKNTNHGHGDWLVDEVTLGESGGIVHEI